MHNRLYCAVDGLQYPEQLHVPHIIQEMYYYQSLPLERCFTVNLRCNELSLS